MSVLRQSASHQSLLALPPVRAVGSRVYRSVAARRTCAVPLEKRLEAERARA